LEPAVPHYSGWLTGVLCAYAFWLRITKDEQHAKRNAQQDVETARQRGLLTN